MRRTQFDTHCLSTFVLFGLPVLLPTLVKVHIGLMNHLAVTGSIGRGSQRKRKALSPKIPIRRVNTLRSATALPMTHDLMKTPQHDYPKRPHLRQSAQPCTIRALWDALTSPQLSPLIQYLLLPTPLWMRLRATLRPFTLERRQMVHSSAPAMMSTRWMWTKN